MIAITGHQPLPEFCVGDGKVDATLAKSFQWTTGAIEQAWTVLQGYLWG